MTPPPTTPRAGQDRSPPGSTPLPPGPAPVAQAPVGQAPWHGIALAALLVGLAALLLAMRRQGMTGDEPRYLLYATALFRHGAFTLDLAEWSPLWQAFNRLPATEVPPPPAGTPHPGHPVAVAALLGPLTALSPFAPRHLTLAVGLAGLWATHGLARRAAGPTPALLAVAVAGFTMPLMPYLHLFYMEAWIFALTALAWRRLQGPGNPFLTAALIAAIPFAHMRGSVVAAALYAFLLWPHLRAGDLRRTALLALPGALGLAALVALNLAVYGTVTGPVNTARPPLPWTWAEVLPMQLFNVRHGLLAYAPVWILGLAGLLAAAWRDAPLARQALLLLAVAAVTGVGVNPGEGWPARFWVLSVPMLTLGLAHWIARERGIAMRLPGALLLGLTLLNTALFLSGPSNFLENRQTTVSYGLMFNLGLPFHPGLFLPVELNDPTQHAAVARLLLGFGALLALGTAAALRPGPRFAVPMALVVLAGLELTRVAALPPREVTLRAEDGAVRVVPATPGPLIALQFGDPRAMWSYERDNRIDLRITRADGTEASRPGLAARQVLPLRCEGDVAAVTLSSPTGLDVAAEAAYRLRLYRPASVLERLATRLGIGCGREGAP